MSHSTIVVAGFGRCGSSLVMQMLAAGGADCMGQFPAFEDDRSREPITPGWAAQCAGRAVKILDPQRIGLPGDCRVIWLDRDVREQAKSFGKFMDMVCQVSVGRDKRRELERRFSSDRRVAMAVIGGRPLLVLRFEDLLRLPAECARSIGAFARIEGFDAVQAARAVRPRNPRCQPGMALEAALLRDPRAHIHPI